MSLSSSTVIHFTREPDALKGILEKGFRIKLCRETVVLDTQPGSFCVPMVSFCDIPFSKIKDHLDKYGEYGIGLTKAWAVRKGLNPVLYMSKDSSLSKSYKTAFNHYVYESDHEIEDLPAETRGLVDIVRYIKNYENDLTRKNKTIPNYRFSDEREWRYVPDHDAYPYMVVSAEWHDNPANKALSDKMLAPLVLDFKPADIQYIIIGKNSEISDFIDHLRKTMKSRCYVDEIDRLTTCIFTAEQIRADV
ncbi:abortive infection system antitoxin AbiGi family protein [Luteimonas aquatica]|uniref:abortive infection system antitoxin AbiGi family protein n=1 Tax=Luteimonas aquatica TaxID=450364 RepID=UPI001F588B65|nr:abortive infection system antitoxin AbiGi family protein [Luteimonas aquatica]